MSTFTTILDQIYPALDDGKYDTALQLCLKPEVSKFSLGKALLAYTYSCLRNSTKALEIARMVAASQPAEDSVVSTLGCTFKVLRAEKDFAELYENAMKKKQLDDSYVLELFSCYCRLNDAKKMQFIAQKFHKTHPNKVCYLFWSVTCMLLQDLPPTMLVLAEKMAQKVLYDLNILTQPSADEMALFAFILVRQGKFSQAYDSIVQLRNRPSGQAFTDEAHFAENPNLVKMLDLQVSVHKLDLLVRQCRFEEALLECKHVLVSQPDQWNVHKLMVDVILSTAPAKKAAATVAPPAPTAAELVEQKQQVFPMQDLSALLTKVTRAGNDGSDSDGEEQAPAAVTAEQVSKVTWHVEYLRELQIAKPKLRGPYLAELYLLSGWLLKLQRQDPATLTNACWAYTDATAVQNLAFATACAAPLIRMAQELASLIASYTVRFQTKQCCFSDLKPYLASLHQIESSLAADSILIPAMRQWAITEREAVGEKLHAAMAAAVTAKSTPSVEVAVTAAPVVETPAAAAPPVAPEGDADDGEGEDDDAADTTAAGATTSTAESATGGASAAAKKKKNKKKKKSAAAKAAASAATTSSTAGTPTVADLLAQQKNVVDEYTDVLLLLCSYCKFDQIVSYCDTLLLASSADLSKAVDQGEEMLRRVALYSASRELFQHGVGGERRNVQPGDELLLQNSSLYRRAFAGVSGSVSSTAAQSTLKAAVQWTRCLLQGKEASPYGFAFKMDLLEPYRALALGEAAHGAFGDMGVKHIQHDSMSYLVLPALVESGYFAEAVRQMRCVANFHVVGKRDSLDMVSKAFQYGNYMKVIELSRFVDHCQRSTQLVLSKVEIPLLEITLKHSTVASALKYLEDLADPKLSDAQGALEGEQVESLIDHMDYHLQVRTDQLDEEALSRETALYRRQLVARIVRAQHISRLLYWALNRDGEKAMVHFQALPQSDNSGAASADSGYHQWSQSFHCEAQATLTEASHKCTKFALSSIATNTVTLSSPPSSSSSVTTAYATPTVKHSGFTSIDEAVQSARATARAVVALRDALLTEVACSKLVSASYVRNMSAFARTVGTEIPLLLQVCLTMFSSPISSSAVVLSADCTASEVDTLLQGITSPPLTPAAVLGQLATVLTALFISTLGKLQASLEKVKSKLLATPANRIADELNALEDPSLAATSADTSTEAADALSMKAVAEVIDLCFDAGGDWSGTATGAAGDGADAGEDGVADAVVVQSAGKVDHNAPKMSKDVSTHAELQLMVAVQMKSSYTESYTRLAALLKERIDALSSALKA